MKRDDDPDRLIRSPGENEGLRTLLSAGQGELPDAARLASLAAKLGPMMGPGGPGGGGGGGTGAAAAKGTVAALGAATVGKAAAVVALVAVGSVAAWRLARSPAPEAPEVTMATPAPTVSSAPAPPPSPDQTPLLVASGEGAGAGKSTSSAARPSPKPVDPDLEVKLLQRAQDSLAADPSAALALCGEHAKAFPRGLLAQEREVLAIDALVRLGRADEANARGRRFAATFPASTHLRRVEALLEQTRHD